MWDAAPRLPDCVEGLPILGRCCVVMPLFRVKLGESGLRLPAHGLPIMPRIARDFGQQLLGALPVPSLFSDQALGKQGR